GRNAVVWPILHSIRSGTSGRRAVFFALARSSRRLALTVARSFPKRVSKAMLISVDRGSAMTGAGSVLRRACTAAFLFAGAGLAGLAATAPARADFRVCNATQNLVGVAIGYRASSGWVTEGWWHVEGSTCKTLIEGAL